MAELWEELNEAGVALDEMIDRLMDADDDRREEAAALAKAAEWKALQPQLPLEERE